MSRYVLALDQGTSSSRAILFDREANIVAKAQRELPAFFPEPGWVEHDPEAIWDSQLSVAQEVLAHAGAKPEEIEAIGIANQRETTLLWDRKTGIPVYSAIVWQDRRTAHECERLKAEGCEPLIRAQTGLPVDPYFSATKLAWILDHVPEARRRAGAGELAFGTVDSFLVWRLSGGGRHVTDETNASRTLLFDIHRGEWSEELLSLFRIPREVLPQVVSSSDLIAETARSLFGGRMPIFGLAGDQQAAAFGQGCYRAGTVKNTYGTGCFALMGTGKRALSSEHGLLTTVAWKLGKLRHYALEGSVFVAGAAIQWLRDQLGLIASAEESEMLARSVEDGGGAYFVPAFSGLGAPHWDPFARGALVGLTRGVTKAHVVRAALESIAHQSRDVLDAMQADSRIEIRELRVDGGACGNDFLMQFQADLLGIPVVRPKTTETTALGAAFLAGIVSGFWRDDSELESLWQAERAFEPNMGADERAARHSQWRRAVERARAWAEG